MFSDQFIADIGRFQLDLGYVRCEKISWDDVGRVVANVDAGTL